MQQAATSMVQPHPQPSPRQTAGQQPSTVQHSRGSMQRHEHEQGRQLWGKSIASPPSWLQCTVSLSCNCRCAQCHVLCSCAAPDNCPSSPAATASSAAAPSLLLLVLGLPMRRQRGSCSLSHQSHQNLQQHSHADCLSWSRAGCWCSSNCAWVHVQGQQWETVSFRRCAG